MVIIDYLTRYCEAFALPNQQATTIAHVLVHQVLLRYRAVRCILTDQGRNFQGKLLKAICQQFDIKQLRTTAYHPQTNGLTERLNGTLVRLLAKACRTEADKTRNWDNLLSHIKRAYNTTPHRMTGESPHFLLYGDDPESPIELTNLFPGYDPLRSGNARMEELSAQLAQRRRWALQVWEAGQAADSLRFDRTHHAIDFKPGDTVWFVFCRLRSS